jgi:hypothetical protein
VDRWVEYERLGAFYSYPVFMGLAVRGRCAMNINILTPKVLAFQLGLKTNKNNDFH